MPESLAVLGLSWEEFLEGGQGYKGFRELWEPGQHLAVVGPTGTGKTTFVRGLLDARPPLRKWVLALDPKGGDTTLGTLGWERMIAWPPPKKFWREIDNGKRTSARLIVGNKVVEKADFARLATTFRNCLDDAFTTGGWTVYIDELQLAADARMMNLTALIEMHLIAARDKRTTIVSSFQRPAHVPRTASDQSTYFATYYTRDVDVVARLGEMAGRPRREMVGLIRGLGDYEHHLLLFSRNPLLPIIGTKPPRAVQRRPKEETKR